MTPAQAHKAVRQLTTDSDRINAAIGELLHNARRNGLHASICLGFLHHKFSVIEDGLAQIVLSATDDPDEIVTEPVSDFDWSPSRN